MRQVSLLAAVIIALAGLQAHAQRRSVGSAAFAVMVTDNAGAPIGDVRVILEGPAAREARTEQGRIAFENLPSGTYHVRFEREGFLPLERDVVARGGAPVDVKVTLEREPPPPPKIEPVVEVPPPPVVEAEPVSIDLPSFIEKNFVGRAAGKSSPLACAAGGDATLLQLREPLAEHTHAAADEYLYVIAGNGVGHAGNAQPVSLQAGVFMLVPRGVRHSLAVSGRSPLVVISVKAGEKCAPPSGQ
jgi:hypothetical protein